VTARVEASKFYFHLSFLFLFTRREVESELRTLEHFMKVLF
jgi:hypothetical protein